MPVKLTKTDDLMRQKTEDYLEKITQLIRVYDPSIEMNDIEFFFKTSSNLEAMLINLTPDYDNFKNLRIILKQFKYRFELYQKIYNSN